MIANDIRKLSVDEINTQIAEVQKELFNLRMQLATGNLENTSQIKKLKTDIARMKLVISEKKREG